MNLLHLAVKTSSFCESLFAGYSIAMQIAYSGGCAVSGIIYEGLYYVLSALSVPQIFCVVPLRGSSVYRCAPRYTNRATKMAASASSKTANSVICELSPNDQ